MKLKFAQFERATHLLENAPDDISDDVLLESNLTRKEIEKINEGLLGDIFGGVFKKLKEKILKAIPGSVLKKADAILKEYKDTEMAIYDKTKKERDKIYVAGDDKNNPRNREQIKRSEKAIDAIEAASKSKKDAINRKLQMIIKDKSEIVKDYVNMQLYQIQEDVATKQLADAQESASEEELDRLEKDIAEKKKKKEAAGKAVEAAKVNTAKQKDENQKKKEEDAKNPDAKKEGDKKEEIPAKAEDFKAGTTLDYKNQEGKTVEVKVAKDQTDQKPGEVSVVGDKKPFVVKIDKLEDAGGKKEEAKPEKLPAKATDFKADDVYEYTDTDGKIKDVKISQYYQDGEQPGNVKVQNTTGDAAGYSVKIDKLKKK